MQARIIKGYSNDEIDEFKQASELVPFTNLIDATFKDKYPHLAMKIKDSRPWNEDKLLYDLADYKRGLAVFKDPQCIWVLKISEEGYIPIYLMKYKEDNQPFLKTYRGNVVSLFDQYQFLITKSEATKLVTGFGLTLSAFEPYEVPYEQ